MDRIGVRERRKSCAARPKKEGRHAVSKIRRAVSMKTAVENSKRCNIAAMRKRLKTVCQRRGIDEMNSFRFHPVKDSCMSGSSPYMRGILHTWMDKAPVQSYKQY